MRAASKIRTFLQRSPCMLGLAGKTISSLPRNGHTLSKVREDPLQKEADRIGGLIEQELLKNETQENISQEEFKERYETSSGLAILRLLYVNTAAAIGPNRSKDQEDPFMDEMRTVSGSQLLGIPVRRLEPLLQAGLLDNRGMRNSQLASGSGNPRHQ